MTPHQKKYDEYKKMKDAVTTEDLIQEFTNIKHFMRDNQIKCFKYNYSLEEIVQNFATFQSFIQLSEDF